MNFDHSKWKALARLRPRHKYLTVYLRPGGTRNQHSIVALRVSDSPETCEGVAGLVWENGSYLLSNLPSITPAEVRAVKNFTDLASGSPILEYLQATNLNGENGWCVMQSMEHFARHFMGFRIQKKDGNFWGVVLLDSQQEQCPFGSSKTGGPLGAKLADRAQVFSTLLEA